MLILIFVIYLTFKLTFEHYMYTAYAYSSQLAARNLYG